MGPQEPKQPVKTAAKPEVQAVDTADTPVKKKGLSKGALWGIIGGAIALVLLVVGIILAVVVFGPPSKADYQKAYDKAKSMKSSYSDLGDSGDFKNAKSIAEVEKALKDAKGKFDKDNSELGGMKAMSDKEVKGAFDTYKTKYDAAMPVVEGTLKMATACYGDKSVTSSMFDFSSKSKQEALDKFDKNMKDCMAVLKDMSSSSNKDLADFGKGYYDYMNEVRTYVGDYAEYMNNTSGNATYPKYPSTSKLPKLDSSNEKYDFTGAFDKLESLLKDKANK